MYNFLSRKLWRNLVDQPVEGSQEGDRAGVNLHQQFSEFSSDISSHFKYGEVRNKRHHKGEKEHEFYIC